MQSVLPSSLTAVTPKARELDWDLGTCLGGPISQSTVTGDVQDEKKI